MDLSPYVTDRPRRRHSRRRPGRRPHPRSRRAARRRDRVLDPARPDRRPVRRRQHHQRRAGAVLGRGADGRPGPEFVVSVPPASAEPTMLYPAGPTRSPRSSESPIDPDDEPVARISLRLPQSVKARVDEVAAADGISTNAWLIRAVMDALADADGPPGVAPAAVPPIRRARRRSSGRTVRSARTACSAPTVPSGPAALFGEQAGPGPRRAAPPTGPGPGLGPMSFRNSTHEGVRRVVLDNLGRGSVTVEPARAAAPGRVLDQRRPGAVPQCGAGAPGAGRAADQLPAQDLPRHQRPPAARRTRGPGVRDQGRVGRRLGRAPTSAGPGSSAARATSASAARATWSASTGSGDVSVAELGGSDGPAVVRVRGHHGGRGRAAR